MSTHFFLIFIHDKNSSKNTCIPPETMIYPAGGACKFLHIYLNLHAPYRDYLIKKLQYIFFTFSVTEDRRSDVEEWQRFNITIASSQRLIIFEGQRGGENAFHGIGDVCLDDLSVVEGYCGGT